MAAAPTRYGSERHRGRSLTLAIVANLLILLVLWHLSPPIADLAPKPRASTFTMLPDRGEAPDATPEKKAVAKPRRASQGAPPRQIEPRPTPPTPVPPPPVVVPNPNAPLPFIQLSREQMAAADIAKLPSHKGEGEGAGEGRSGEDDSGDSVAAVGPGEGPGGQRLYAVAWLHGPPTDAQLAFYLPKGAPPGSWGEIACQTVERFQVDNCRALGDSRPGLGLARGMVNAAWQFRVTPPRIGSKSLVGAWVRIRINITENGVTAGRP